MPPHRIPITFSICLIAGLVSPQVVAEDVISPGGESEPKAFGEIQPYDTTDNALLGLPKDKNDGDETQNSSRAFGPDAIKVYQNALLVNDIGDPKRIVFEGVSMFSEAELRHALACDLKYQAAARPSAKMEDLLITLEQRLREGYLHCGCPDTKVRAELDGKRHAIVVHVDEGKQFRKGNIHVAGSKTIDEQAIINWLTTQQSARSWNYEIDNPTLDVLSYQSASKTKDSSAENNGRNGDADPVTYWKPGEIVDFRDANETELSGAIRLALIEAGFATCRFHGEMKQDPTQGVVDLHISILDDVPRTVIGETQITGLKRDTREELLDYLKIAPGDPLDGKTIARINDRLADSCRYWTHRLTITVPSVYDVASTADENKANLRLALEEYEPVAPLNKPLEPTDEIMRKCAVWIQSLGKDFGDWDLVCSTEAFDLGGGLQQSQMAIASDGTLVVEGLCTTTQGWRADHILICGLQGAEAYDWQHGDKFCVSHRLQPKCQLHVRADHGENGEQESALSAGYAWSAGGASAAASLFSDVRVEPAAVVRMARLPSSKTEVRDGILTLKNDEFEFRIDEKTGALRSMKCASFLSAGVAAIDINFEKGLVEELIAKTHRLAANFPNRYDDSNPLGSILSFGLQQIGRQPPVRMSPSLSRLCHRGEVILNSAIAKQRLADWTQEWGLQQSDKAANKFEIAAPKSTASADWSGVMTFWLPAFADEFFPRSSWPWTLCREVTFYKFSDGAADESTDEWIGSATRELSRWFKHSDDGPVSSLLLAQTLCKIYYDRQDSFSFIALKGSRDLSDEAFLKDVRMLTKGDHGLAVACRAIAEYCGGLSDADQEDICEFLPEEIHGPFKRLVVRRNEKLDELPGAAIEAVLLECWHDSLKDIIEAELRGMSDKIAHPPETGTATK